MNNKKIGKALLSLAFISLLASCSETIVNYPSNEDDNVVTVTGDDNGDVTDNQYADIYKDISSSSSASSNTLDNILYNMAVGTNGYLTGDNAISDTDIAKKYKKSMLDSAMGGTFSVDNKFDEYRFALSIMSSGYTVKTSTGATDIASIKAAAHTPQVINPDLNINGSAATQDEKFTNTFSLDYTDYIDRYFKPTITRQYLTAYYIYNNSYSSIGNTSARDITMVKITDRDDKPGEAIKLIRAWVKDKINTDDYDLHNLARLWKGVDVTAAEQTWLDNNNISNLSSKIDEEVNKICDNFTGTTTDWSSVTSKSEYTTDSSLESTYTGSYTYSIEKGYDLARRNLEVSSLITEGTYLNSSTISDAPSTLKSNIFSSNIKTSTADIDKIVDGTTKDATSIVRHNSGADNQYDVRYVAPSITISGNNDTVDKIVTYDSSTKSYFIVQLNSIVTTSIIAQNTSDDAAAKATKKTLAMNAAYEMSSTDTNKKSAIVWFLTNNTIDYSDPDFYNYIKTNYPDAIDD